MPIIDTQQMQHLETQKACSTAISRFFVASVGVGLLIGLFEAALLLSKPRVQVLLYPDVGYVIWFLAPMVDMLFFGFVGLGMGWIAGWTGKRRAALAFSAGIAVTFVALMLRWFHVELGLHLFFLVEEVFTPIVCLILASTASFLILNPAWNRLASRCEKWAGTLFKPVAVVVFAATVIAIAGIGLFSARPLLFRGFAANTATPADRVPNVILIVLDTVRADHLSAYGYSRPTTPHLDRFAREGVLFENAIAPASWTLASHASIFTGLLPHQNGANWATPLLAAPYTLAEIMNSRGYDTAGVIANTAYLEDGWGIAQGFRAYEDGTASLQHNLSETLVGNAIIQPVYQNFYRYDWFDRQNAQQINSRVFQWFHHRSNRPFFLFINYMDAHDPYLPPAPYNHRFGKVSMDLVRHLHVDLHNGGSMPWMKVRDRTAVMAGYDNSLAYLDEQVGQLLQLLRESPEWQNTVIIITADHGEEFGEHGRYTHGFDVNREVLHVPLIIEGPGVPQNLRVQHLVGTRGLFSTVLDLTGRGKAPFSTYSLARYWNPNFRPGPFDDIVVSEFTPYESKNTSMISFTTSKWQYIYNSTGRQELYDWNADPKEQNDLAGTADGQKMVQNFYARLVERIGRSTRPWWGAEYLLRLGRQGPFLHDVLFTLPSQPGANRNEPQMGAAQAYFLSRHSRNVVRPTPSEQDLMQSLPYH